jgi:hypothetical protein
MEKIRNISKYALQGIIPLIFIMFLNASINKHYHILPSGEVIIHSHFAGDSSTKAGESHSHSEEELQLLNLIGNPETLIVLILLGIVFLLFAKKQSLEFFDEVYRDFKRRFFLHNKAPPVYC